MGKSLFVDVCGSELDHLTKTSASCKQSVSKSERKTTVVTVPIHGTAVDTDEVVNALLVFEEKLDAVFPRIYHFDVAPTVTEPFFLFHMR